MTMTMTKLYTVRLSFDYVVVAEDDHDAFSVAIGQGRNALGDMSIHDCDIDVTEGVTAEGWDDMCIPYGGDGNKRTGEYLKEINGTD